MTAPTSLAEAILAQRRRIPGTRSVLAGITGIDGSGKGYVAGLLHEELARRGLKAVVLGVDGWLNLPKVRFGGPDPGARFYHQALRLDRMFEELVIPLRDRRSCRVEMDYAEETADAYRRHTYEMDDVDVVLLEGIFLLKKAYRSFFDQSIWLDCSFGTALRRAIGRSQEGLSPEATIRAYETIYFPAQRIHMEIDDPRGAAGLIFPNDPDL